MIKKQRITTNKTGKTGFESQDIQNGKKTEMNLKMQKQKSLIYLAAKRMNDAIKNLYEKKKFTFFQIKNKRIKKANSKKEKENTTRKRK